MVETKHKNFNLFYSKWIRMRHTFAGNDAMKENATKYIPPLSGQTPDQYKEVINRETFENYTLATAKGMSGLIFAKSPVIELGTQLTALAENIDLAGSNLIDLAQNAVNEVSETGRIGLLVDMITPNIEITSTLQEQQLNLRPYIKTYTTENIINWDTQLINNRAELSFLVLSEPYMVRTGFTFEDKVRYRVYELIEGICTVRVFEENNKAFNLVSEVIVRMQGKAIDFIPFVSITSEKLSIDPVNPPLLDLADINISHWYLNVERRNALHFVGFPSIYGVGIQKRANEEVKLGAGTINIFDNPQAKLDFLQLSAEGLGSVEKALEEKKNAMLALGAKILAPESASQISENTMQMKTAGQRAVNILIADTVSRGIEKALGFVASWVGETVVPKFQLNTDYNLSEMNPQMLAQIYAGKQMGILRNEDVYYNLVTGEIIDENVTMEEYLAGIEEQNPLSMPTSTAPTQTNTNNSNSSVITALKAKLGL